MKRLLTLLTTLACWLYFLCLFGWLAAALTTRDRFAPVSIASFLAVYLFLPLPLVLLAAIPLRRASVWAGAILGILAFAGLWGRLFLPNSPQTLAGAPALTVMTYNLLGWQEHSQEQIDVIRAENPDLLLMQELNPALARALRQELAGEYPYQVLHPQDGVGGMGVISKYPLHDTALRLPLEWVGEPQVLEMDWEGHTVGVVNFHMIPTTSFVLGEVAQENAYRQAQARALVELAGKLGPAVIGGDANATPLSGAHQILAGSLVDAWDQAGFGLGHTFPGSDLPSSSRPRLLGWSSPQWLARIDYVFFTPGWQALSAHTARFDGVSDHRGVIATLTIQD